ncbi:hypothetical protein ACKWTF_014642 [Chironomus riparius]
MNCSSVALLILLSILYPQDVSAAKQRTTNSPKAMSRFKSIRCATDNVTVSVIYCYLKAISRKLVTANVGVKILIPMHKIGIQFILNYRYGLIFRPVIDTKYQDWCAIMKGADTNPYIKLLIDIVKETASSGIHRCPYTDEFHIDNVTINYDKVDPTALFPEGTYKIQVLVFVGKKEVMRLELDEEVKSPLKETFG